MYDTPDLTPEAQDTDDRLWGTIAHLSTLLPIPLFNLLGPAIVLLAKGNESYFVKRQAISALNFQFTLLIAYIVCVPLIFVIIGIPLIWLIGIVSMVLTFIAGIKAIDGYTYPYPMSFRFIS